MEKIRYRLTYNYGGRLNKDGLSAVALECRQGCRKIYISSKVMLSPDQWRRGMVVNHDNAEKLTVYLARWRNRIEAIELDFVLKGRSITLNQLKDAIKNNVRPSATLREFVTSVIESDSSRSKNTRRSYEYLVRDIERTFGRLTIEEVCYDLIIRYRESMRKKGLSENTVKGKLKALRCVLEEAKVRDLIPKNPFDAITIGNISARQGFLTAREVKRIEMLQLKGQEAKVRDFFLFSCYTGLRFSDVSTLDQAEIRKGILRKVMCKTHHEVVIPIGTLFYGKAQQILDKYQDIHTLSKCASNSQINRILKDIAAKAGIKKRVYIHLGRKTFNSMLNTLGVPLEDRKVLMGHTDSKVTQEFYTFNDSERVIKSVKKLFK